MMSLGALLLVCFISSAIATTKVQSLKAEVDAKVEKNMQSCGCSVCPCATACGCAICPCSTITPEIVDRSCGCPVCPCGSSSRVAFVGGVSQSCGCSVCPCLQQYVNPIIKDKPQCGCSTCPCPQDQNVMLVAAGSIKPQPSSCGCSTCPCTTSCGCAVCPCASPNTATHVITTKLQVAGSCGCAVCPCA